MPVVMACMSMSRGKVGALIVIERGVMLEDIVETGDLIDARINQRLIENIFFKNSPLHDGAMVISKRRIKAAGCILPVSHKQDIPKELGLRHRAAMGISQDSDALAIIVSGDRTYQCCPARRVPAEALCRAAGEHPDKGDGTCLRWAMIGDDRRRQAGGKCLLLLIPAYHRLSPLTIPITPIPTCDHL